MVRWKKRYIVIDVLHAPKALRNTYNFKKELLANVKKLHGDWGVAMVTSGLAVKRSDENTGTHIIRVMRGPHNMVLGTLSVMTGISSIVTAATIKQAYCSLKKYHEVELRKELNSTKKHGMNQVL